MSELSHGVSIGIGGTNFRTAILFEGELEGFKIRPTPEDPEMFFETIGQVLLRAADAGATYGVVGVPGPVSQVNQEQWLGTMPNVPGLSEKCFSPIHEMSRADPAVGRLIDEGFRVRFENDGNLAVHAAVARFAGVRSVIADIIVGTGVGGAVAWRDKRFPDAQVFHADPGAWELGHNFITADDPEETDENTISGPAIEARTGKKPEDLVHVYESWKPVYERIAIIAANLGLNATAELVIVSGGVGIGVQKSIRGSVKNVLLGFRGSANKRADLVPEIKFVPKDMADTYELYGARGVMQSHLIKTLTDSLATDPVRLSRPLSIARAVQRGRELSRLL